MISQHTRSKRPNLCTPLGIVKRRKKLEMVSATHLHNFMIDDCLVDWLKLRSRQVPVNHLFMGQKMILLNLL